MVQPQYFGDNRDYLKYDLITSIFQARLLESYVFVPMLTESRNDGQGRITPKNKGDKSLELFNFIKSCQIKSLDHWETWLTPHVSSYRTVYPVDQAFFRDESRTDYWGNFRPLMDGENTLVFVDPDTGLQTGTPSYRKRMGAEKYLLNNEVIELFSHLHPTSALMIYQHLPRNKNEHVRSTRKKLALVKSNCNTELTCAYREDDLAFVFVAGSEAKFRQLLSFLANYYVKSVNAHRDIIHLGSNTPIIAEQVQKLIRNAVAVMQHMDDLDCAAWALQVALNLDPHNMDAGELLQRIIKEIDRRFDAGEDAQDTPCHIAMGRESPSLYVRQREPTDSRERLEMFIRRRDTRST